MSGAKVQAVVMAGGEGSRLRPLTGNMPKPMLSVANRPLMERIVRLLREDGFTDIVATVQFLSSVIRNYFGDGSDLGVSIAYSTEEEPLGTAGSVLNARDLLSGEFVVISGDALTDMRPSEALDFHRAKGAAATLVLKRMRDPLEFGIVMTDEDGRIERFLEKPTWGQVFSDTINTGIYVLEPEVLDLIPPDQPFDFSAELFPMMLDKGLPVYGFITDAYWADVGNTEAYLEVHHDILEGRVKVDMPGFELKPGVWVGEDVDIEQSATIHGPSIIGDNCRIGWGATVGPLTVIGDNAIVDRDAQVSSSVLMDQVRVGPMAQARGSILGRDVSVDDGATVEEGAVLGDEVAVGAGALIKAGLRVYPSRSVEAGAIVTQSVIKEQKASRTLFGPRGVAGLVNIDITAQVAVRLGMAYGTVLERNSVVITGRDASRAARAIKRALIAGLNSTGVHCHDLEMMPMPVTRFTVRSRQATGGISVRTSPENAEVVEVRLFDEEGTDLPAGVQRKIERIFFRDDYRRPGHTKLGELEFPPHAVEQYSAGLLRSLDVDAVRGRKLKVVVDYAHGPACLIGPSFLGRLGCDALSLNAYTDEHRGAVTRDELTRMLNVLSDHVRASGSDLGVLLEPGGEVARLVDDRGRVLAHEQAMLAFLRHEASRLPPAVAVPVSATSRCDDIAREAGVELLRTQVGLPSLMTRALRPGVGFVGDPAGTLIFPRFLPAPDALMTFGKALEMVALSSRAMSDLVDRLPETHVATRDVRTPWHLKGTVMREVAARADQEKLMLLDGVKILEGDGRWALVIPHGDEPLCRVWAEGATAAEADETAVRYARLIEEMVEAGGNGIDM
jgi:mannose-1-phosphate guanylyltransferase / phosphomannomutase